MTGQLPATLRARRRIPESSHRAHDCRFRHAGAAGIHDFAGRTKASRGRRHDAVSASRALLEAVISRRTLSSTRTTARLRAAHPVRALIAASGERASLRFQEFFAANIRGSHTRRAYDRAVTEFLAWCDDPGRATGDSRAAAPRRRVDRDAAAGARRADHQDAASGDPPPVRLAGDRPDGASEPGRLGARPLTCDSAPNWGGVPIGGRITDLNLPERESASHNSLPVPGFMAHGRQSYAMLRYTPLT